MKNFKYLSFLAIIFILAGYFGLKHWPVSKADQSSLKDPIQQALPETLVIKDKKLLAEVKEGDTYGKLMENAGVGGRISNLIYEAAKDKYDLARVRLGHALELIYEKDSDQLKELVYKIDSEEEISIRNAEFFPSASSTSGWSAEIRPIAYEVKVVVKEGEVKSSMYEAAKENSIDERAIIALADAFQWSIDFAMDPRVGDKFRLVYEERYLAGRYAMPGKILAGRYVNDGTNYEVYYFEESPENIGYFDENGNSVQKMFLKAPVAFKYISSSFTTGKRYIEAFDVYTGHRAVDYAADYGVPIRSVGDGVVTSASYSGSYGNIVKVRHNGTYSTNYGHMSKFAVKAGAKVKQGQVIGYVGSTGFSTGPHVHFEMVKNGVKINPLAEILPPGQAVKPENKDRFFSDIKEWQALLGAR